MVIQAKFATVAETVVKFDDVLGWRDFDTVDGGLVNDIEELVSEKQVLKERLESEIDAVGSDPLGANLLRQMIRKADRGSYLLNFGSKCMTMKNGSENALCPISQGLASILGLLKSLQNGSDIPSLIC